MAQIGIFMSDQKEIKELIITYARRLQKLKEQRAYQGSSADPKILMETEDIEVEIEKLQVHSKNVEPGLSLRYEANNEPFMGCGVDAGYQTVVFYRLNVDNIGTPAENCEVILSSVDPLSSARGKKLGRPVVLKWAHEEVYSPITIEPGESRKLDFFYIFVDKPRFIEFYFKEPSPPMGLSRTFPAGSYRITLRVKSNNAGTVKASFIVETDGISMFAGIEERD
jgi:hypothetical protein